MRMLLVTVTLISSSAFAQDTRFIKLEQDMRNLERQVQTLARQVDELHRSQRASTRPAAADSREDNTTRDWLAASNWKRLKVGTSELEVIDLLGPPTSMRQEGEQRVLLYAMEIGSNGFLGGSVTVRDKAVVSVEVPTLR